MTVTVLQPGAEGTDTWINLAAPTTNYGTETDIRVQPYDVNTRKRGLLAFDMSSISGSVSAGTLSLYLGSLVGAGTITVNVHELTQSWTENGATWNTYDGVNNWASAGGDFGTVIGSNTAVGTADAWYDFTLSPSIVNGWRTTNKGIIVKGSDETLTINDRDFVSSDSGSATLRPKLTVDFVGGDLDLTSKLW